MDAAILVAVTSDFLYAFSKDGTFAGRDLLRRIKFAGSDIVFVLGEGIHIFFEPFAGRSQPDPSWFVKISPRIFAAHDQVGDQHAGNDTVRHAVAGISGRDVDVILV